MRIAIAIAIAIAPRQPVRHPHNKSNRTHTHRITSRRQSHPSHTTHLSVNCYTLQLCACTAAVCSGRRLMLISNRRCALTAAVAFSDKHTIQWVYLYTTNFAKLAQSPRRNAPVYGQIKQSGGCDDEIGQVASPFCRKTHATT